MPEQKKPSPLTSPKNRNKPQKKRKPLGSGIDWSDEDLDKLSEITEADLKAADALWRAEAPKPLKKLLQADVEDK